MTYPPPEPGRQPEPPPPSDPFQGPPGFDPPPYGGRPDPYQPGPHPPGPPFGAAPTRPFGVQPGSGPPATGPGGGYAAPVGGHPPSPPYRPVGPTGPYPHPPRGGRRGLLIVAAVAAGVVLCAGGGLAGLLLLRDSDRDGADTPTAAVQSFLQAVYRDQDPERAAELVCSESRDQAALETKIAEIAAYRDTYLEPRFSWSDPELVNQGEELATVSTTVTMITGDERVSDLALQVTVLDKGSAGWWVCDLTAGVADPPDGDDPTGEDGDDGETSQPSEPAESGG